MTVRIAVVGCGSIARSAHLPAFVASSRAELVAFASRSRSSAEAAAAECGGTGRIYDDWRDAVVADDVDAVDICSPNAFHCEQALAAMRAGKHVLVDKPIAVTTSEADEMLEGAEQAGVVLQVTHNLRYVPTVAAARAVVAGGRLGEVLAVRASFGHGGPKTWAPAARWFYDPKLSGGGALIDLGIHIVDVVSHVTVLPAAEVTAMTAGNDPCEDAAQVIVGYANGAIGAIHSSWVVRPGRDMSLTVFGTDGTLHFDMRSPLTLRPADGEKEIVALPEIAADPYDDFVRTIQGERPIGAVASGQQARDALAIVSAAYESARSGKTVAL